MDIAIIKCQDLMVGDWITNESGLPTQIITISSACAYAIFGGDEGDPWVFDDYIYLPTPIPLTPEILEKNGFGFIKSDDTKSVWNGQWIYKDFELATCCLDREGNWPCYINICDLNIKCEYVHQLQHALRLCGLNELANNFKI